MSVCLPAAHACVFCVLPVLCRLPAAASAPNTAQGAPPAADRPAAYEEALRTGAGGQNNSPCPTGKIPCYYLATSS